MAEQNLTTEQYLDAARSLHDIHEDLVMRVRAFVKVARTEISNMVDTDNDGLSFLVASLELLAAESIKHAEKVTGSLYMVDAA